MAGWCWGTRPPAWRLRTGRAPPVSRRRPSPGGAAGRPPGGAGPRLAAAPITWGVCELPRWGDVPAYSAVLDEMVASGFDGTELGPPGFLPARPDALRLELARRDLALVGAFCPLTLHEPAAARE